MVISSNLKDLEMILGRSCLKFIDWIFCLDLLKRYQSLTENVLYLKRYQNLIKIFTSSCKNSDKNYCTFYKRS